MKQDRTIRLCGLKFKRQCPLNWDALKPTADVRSRYCGTCDRSVFLCESDEETMCTLSKDTVSRELFRSHLRSQKWFLVNRTQTGSGQTSRPRSKRKRSDSIS